jgi:putative copper export protein/methionine-rich copper-binding protein CopC
MILGGTRLGLGTLLAACILASLPARAWAHPFLRRSTPAASDTVGAGPTELRLVFSEPIELRFTRVQLVGPDGAAGSLGTLTIVADSLGIVVVPVNGVLPRGGYIVRWQAAGDDGHIVRGEYAFTVLARPDGGEAAGAVPAPHDLPSPGMPHTATAADQQGFDAGSPAFVALRWIMYLGLLGIIGSVAFEGIVLALMRRRGGEAGRRLAETVRAPAGGVGLAAAAVLLLSVPGRLVAQTVAMHGGQSFDATLVTGMLAHTMWGWSWLAQLGAGMLAFAAFRRASRGQGGWGLAAVAAVVLAFTPAFAGHAIAAERWIPVAVLSDGIHVLGAAGWLGTLGVLVIVGIPAALRMEEADRGSAAADLVNAFSPVALVCAGTAAATGVLSAVIHIGRIPDLWQTGYGQILLLKLAILSVVAGTGAFNWRKVRPVLGDELGARRIRRSATIEVAVATAVLLVTAILVALPTPLAARGP